MNTALSIPPQKFHVGDLVVATEDYFMHLKEGEVGVVIDAFCHEVCSKGGVVGLAPEDGGPEHVNEWGYIGLFDATTRPQGIRLDRLSPVEIVQ